MITNEFGCSTVPAQGAMHSKADSPIPEIAILSNGSYHVMITDSGAGISSWRNLDVTRWREDATRDCWGQFVYFRDIEDGKIWSIGRQPLCHVGDEYEVVFQTDRAEFHRRDADIETRLSICVSPDQDAEVRLVTLVNHGTGSRELDLTSYAEVCLNTRGLDRTQPAFEKLFLETEFVRGPDALIAHRRLRAADEKPAWAVHVTAVDDSLSGELEYETDRARFLGRGRTSANPAALNSWSHLSETTGAVLDPIFCLRRHVFLLPGGTARVAFVTGAAETYEAANAIAENFRQLAAADLAFNRAQQWGRERLRELGLTADDVDIFNRLAGNVIFTGPALRRPEAIAANRMGQPGLWRQSISGDRPIVLVLVADGDETLVHQLVCWHVYARRRGLEVDLVILDERIGDSVGRLKSDLYAGLESSFVGKPGGVFILETANVPKDDAILLAAAARVVLGGSRGTLADQLQHGSEPISLPPPLSVISPSASKENWHPHPQPAAPRENLLFWNGHGGFSEDGREYVIIVDRETHANATLPPAPWSNVLANSSFGCLVTEAGLGCSWAGNSQLNRLTPWNNDPISDTPSEAVYLRDEDTGEVWTPTPLPVGSGAFVRVRHGQGYTCYIRQSHGLEQELVVLVPSDDPVKLVRLSVRNNSDRPRRLSATFYAEWVLGGVRDNAPMQVVCEYNAGLGTILAHSAWAGDFAGQVAFASVGSRVHSATADRAEFLGRCGSMSAPAGLKRSFLSGRDGPLLDPCAALMTPFSLAAGQSEEVVFVLGQAETAEQVRSLVTDYTSPGRAQEALRTVQDLWDRVLTTVQVRTPDPAMDLMLNRWLLYQVLACRVWGRSAFYQSSGAYGFRDQLQDVMALVTSVPQETRAQILRAASRQFEEGDVQHWWHPPAGRGVRTRITDDLYFLPLVVHHYVITTGDIALLQERVAFLKSPVLRADQKEDYGLPAVSEQTGTVYEHCVRALEHGYQLGSHGLPLMGAGDWDDGMNMVGVGGKGESVWNGWFFITVLKSFAELAAGHGDAQMAAWCRERVEALRAALETHAWDGGWYRRAYFDDGTPLGSAQNDECQITAIPQAWAVISGVADPARSLHAMAAVEQRLVHVDDKLIQLLDPPFDKGTLQPGYIKGYVPGIRENGGQYTHAATWIVLATALQDRGNHAFELWSLLNPINHATTLAEVDLYKVEPYVVCGDVYGVAPHTGRGGWTWYTGSAGWMYRVALEAILGIRPAGDSLLVDPCIPEWWPGYEITYRHQSATYRIVVENPSHTGCGVLSVTVDGKPTSDGQVPLRDDGQVHDVRVMLG